MATTLERVLRRDRLLISIVLSALTVVSWAQMVLPKDVPLSEERLMPCCGARFDVAFAMWVVMMAGMMIPSVAPMVLTHAAITRRRAALGAPFVSSGLFLAGYLLAWSGFSAVAALAQSMLYRGALLDGHSLSIGPWAGGAVLLAAGIFQLSPAKSACLSQCRSPLGYFVTEWRDKTCDFALSWWIKQGHAGAVDLAGLRVVMAGRWETTPGDPWRVILYIDDRATPAQKDAVAAVFLGRAGGTTQKGFAARIVEVHAVKSARIELDHTPVQERIEIAPYLTVKTREAVPHDFTVTCSISGHDHAGRELRAETFRYQDAPFDWDVRGKCGFFTDFAYSS